MNDYLEIGLLAVATFAVFIVLGKIPQWIGRLAARGGGGAYASFRTWLAVALIALFTVAIVLLWRSLLEGNEFIFWLAAFVTGAVGLIWAGSIMSNRKR